ncbi:MAG: 4a-hydroxytetrahydrobiopterin dehydratase [Pseudorhodoferax sp.]
MKLSPTQLQPLLAQLPAWQAGTERGGTLSRSFVFRDFAQAMGFMCQIAVHAEKHDHHPEWFNVYNRVDVTLTTHDAGGLSLRDIRLARTMDQVAAALALQAAPTEEPTHA